MKQAKKSYLSKVLYKPRLSGNSKSFYCYIRENKENGSNITPHLTFNNSTAKTSAKKANMLNKFFKSVFVPDDGADLQTKFNSSDQNDVNITVKEEGIYKLLLNIDISMSCGPDDIPGILLKPFLVLSKV